jgi:hypothetical protein
MAGVEAVGENVGVAELVPGWNNKNCVTCCYCVLNYERYLHISEELMSSTRAVTSIYQAS